MANAHNKEHATGHRRSGPDKAALGDESSGRHKYLGGARDAITRELTGKADGLVHTIEGEIIPRLLLAHQSAMRQAGGSEMPGEQSGREHIGWSGLVPDETLGAEPRDALHLTVTPDDVMAFAELLIAFEPRIAKQFIDTQLARGHTVCDLLLDLCAPAARELGDMWKRDACSFCDVTIGLSTLEQVVLHCAGPAGDLPKTSDRDRCVLLTPMPGNQHVFGLLIVKELFRRSGWTVRGPAKPDSASVLNAVRKTRYSVLGLSVGSADDLQACQSLVKACRAESLNPKLLIMVGGHGIQEANMSTRMLGCRPYRPRRSRRVAPD
jgi:methanogenic corrinoid protein MtbC1